MTATLIESRFATLLTVVTDLSWLVALALLATCALFVAGAALAGDESPPATATAPGCQTSAECPATTETSTTLIMDVAIGCMLPVTTEVTAPGICVHHTCQ